MIQKEQTISSLGSFLDALSRLCYACGMQVVTRNAGETKKIASLLAREAARVRIGTGALVFALSGDLGSGKTTFVQGFASALGIKERILSPTFVLMKIYTLRATDDKPRAHKYLVHIDCYRVRHHRDLRTLGLEMIVHDPRALVLVEWPEKIKRFIPKNALRIRFRHGKRTNERTLSFDFDAK